MRRAILCSLVAAPLAGCAWWSSDTDELTGKTWTLRELPGASVNVSAADRDPTLMFQAKDGRAAGSSGCNSFGGSYKLSGNSLSFGALAMTRMACAQGMDVETAYANALQATRGYWIEGSRLTLTGASGRALAVFAAE